MLGLLKYIPDFYRDFLHYNSNREVLESSKKSISTYPRQILLKSIIRRTIRQNRFLCAYSFIKLFSIIKSIKLYEIVTLKNKSYRTKENIENFDKIEKIDKSKKIFASNNKKTIPWTEIKMKSYQKICHLIFKIFKGKEIFFKRKFFTNWIIITQKMKNAMLMSYLENLSNKMLIIQLKENSKENKLGKILKLLESKKYLNDLN